MSEKNLSNKIAGSLFWKFLERGGVQVVQFIVSIVIARLLDPSAYGIVALITVFTTIATVFVQSGLNTALVQKKDATSMEYSSVFYYSLFVAFALYIILFFSAGWIAGFYEIPQLKLVLQIMALTLFPGALNSIQIAVLSKRMQFRLQFYSGMIAAIVSGVLGIVIAAMGGGVWALVVQQLSYQTLICVILWFLVKWRPTLEFSFQKTKSLLKFGSKVLSFNLINTLYSNIESLIIGKKYSESDLAFFSKGKQFPLIMIDNIDGSIQSVMFATYVKYQEDVREIKRILRKTMSLNTYLVFPAMLGLAVIGKPLIWLVLGESWLPCVPFLQIYCILSMFTPMQTANIQAINAVGRVDVSLWINAIKKSLGLFFIFLALLFFDTVISIAYVALITSIISVVINIFPSKKYLNYSLIELLKDIGSNLICALIMTIIIVLIGKYISNLIVKMLVQIIVGIAVYGLLSILLKNKDFFYIKDFLNNKRQRGEK